MEHVNGTDVQRPAAPVLRKETHSIEGLGEVIVRMLKFSERLAIGRAGEADQTGDLFVPRLLAAAVSDMGGAPLFTVEEWDVWAAVNPKGASVLTDVALRLGGYGGDAAKNA